MRSLLPPLFLVFAACSPPSRGYECIAPANPGGGWDLSCRALAQVANELAILPQTMRVLNLPGAGGGIAFAHTVAERRRDENLLVAASPSTTLRIAENQFGEFDENDVRWVGAIAADFGVIVVGRDTPFRNLSDLIEAWRNAPDDVVVAGGSAVGGQDHMRVLLLADAAGLDLRSLRYVPFDGGGEAITALLGGFVEVVPVDASEVSEQVRAGNVRALAVLGPERLGPPFDSVPTAREEGYDVASVVWRGFYAPREIDEEAYAHWVEVLNRIEVSDSWSRVRGRFGLTPYSCVGADFETLVRQEVERFRILTSRLGLVS
jgi:putative tricarboxylic transport membrane protein